MKLKKVFNLLLISGCILALSACSAPGTGQNGQAGTGHGYGYNNNENNAEASGTGENARFSGTNQRHLMMQRVYYFDFDRNDVHEEYKPAIYANAEYLVAHPNVKVIVEGHTDPRGSREYNVALGEHRANAVAEILKERGVSPQQIRVVSYGAERLATEGHTEEDYQQDRRAIIVYTQG